MYRIVRVHFRFLNKHSLLFWLIYIENLNNPYLELNQLRFTSFISLWKLVVLFKPRRYFMPTQLIALYEVQILFSLEIWLALSQWTLPSSYNPQQQKQNNLRILFVFSRLKTNNLPISHNVIILYVTPNLWNCLFLEKGNILSNSSIKQIACRFPELRNVIYYFK